MRKIRKYVFEAKVYKVLSNKCIDIPKNITDKMIAKDGGIKIKGKINGFPIHKTLVPVKNYPYRLYIGNCRLKERDVGVGEKAKLVIQEDSITSLKIIR